MTDSPDFTQFSINETPKPKRRAVNSVVTVLIVFGIIGVAGILLIAPAVNRAATAASRLQCMSNLKQIGLALISYHSKYDAFPPAYTVDENGKPLHSWRTLILPYLGETVLYDSINLSKAWDDPANAEAFKARVTAFQCPVVDRRGNHTVYMASVGPNACFHPTEPRNASEITDGNSNTLMVVEVDHKHAIHWMAPVDADENLILGLGAKSELAHAGGFNALLADGSVRFVPADLPPEQRRALISIDGKDSVGEF